MASERTDKGKPRGKNSSLQDYDGKKKWSSRGELSARSSSTLEYPKKSSKTLESLSDDEDERNSSKKRRRLFPFSSKSKKERNGSGDLKKRSKSREGDLNKEGSSKHRAARSYTISDLSVSQLQKRMSREVKPIFGLELKDAVQQSRSIESVELPLVVRECIDHAEEFGLETPGIYRISGIKSKIEALKTAYNEGKSVDLKECDTGVVTGLLKQYLRELPESVLTQELGGKFEEAAAVPNDNLRIDEFQAVLKELPSCNYTLLSWIIIHLIHVLDHADTNKMSIQNLSIVFSPTMRISHRVLFHLFTNGEALFGHIKIKKCRKPLHLDTSGQVELSDDVGELEEELQYHERLLNKMHEDLNKGIASHGTEEELWEVQRIVTQIKRKLRKAKSLVKQPAKETQEDDEKIENVDQKSTDSKTEDGSSTGTDENKLTESEKDVNVEEGPKEEVEAAAITDVTSKEEGEEAKSIILEDVKVEIHEEKVTEEPVIEEEDEEESLESLYLFYSEMTAKQDELINIRTELQRRIEMEKLEVARLKAEIEAAKVSPKVKPSTSSSVDVSSNSSSDSEDEEELQDILKKLLEDNERLKNDNLNSSLYIQQARENCADLKAKMTVETKRSDIIRDLQDELEKDKAKKEEKIEDKRDEETVIIDKETVKKKQMERIDVVGDSEC